MSWSKKRIIFCVVGLIIMLIIINSMYGYLKASPEGVSFEGELRRGQVEFLFDLTYQRDGDTVMEQVIFERILAMIDDSEDFIILDMFLFNDEYERTVKYPAVSGYLADSLIRKKQQDPTIEIIVITDRINTFYGSYSPEHLIHLEQEGIQLVYTDMTIMRDSNPSYSGLWRTMIQWFGTSENGWLPNPFSPDSPVVTIRSYLELMNFKANHRKVVITEKEALVTSENPHDASAYHSNIAFVVKGEVVNDLIETERAVADISGANTDLFEALSIKDAALEQLPDDSGYSVQVLTEGKIKQHLLKDIRETEATNKINIGAFYLSDRDVVKELIKASERKVEIKIILDANKDAFGREKNGIPNRPVAHELKKNTNNAIKIKWYNTNGEQYHTKLVMIEKNTETILLGGSANLTKRNIADFNLETNIKVIGSPDSEIMQQASNYFQRLWSNEDGIYTLDYNVYEDDSIFNQFLYRFQEWSGISTF
ncbi:MAG: phospholipase [Desulfitibacter sp. BRH_c19]|nr:MAG: phospholipase [Desulfitibacter sp. BRH_c19]